jgi:PilZ domain-containing protein
MDQSSISQNRRSRRSNVLMAAAVETATGLANVTLRNLSSDGALIEGDRIPEQGYAVIFRKKELVISGRIAWVNGRRAGIAFDSKLEPETVLRHVPAPKHRIDQQHKRPGFSNALTEQERRWCETVLWGSPLPVIG